jgi:putative transposase
VSNNDIIIESETLRLSDKIWAKARYGARILSPITDRDVVSKSVALEAANKLNLSERTIYNLIRRWRESGGSITSLVSHGSNGGKGHSRLPKDTESLVSNAIVDTYLSRHKITVTSLTRVIKEGCNGANFILK